MDRKRTIEDQEDLMWAVVEGGTYAHVFTELDKPFKMVGQLISWASVCGRSYAIEEPQPNPKKKKCTFCLDKENGHHE